MRIGRLPTGPLDQLIEQRSTPFTIYKEMGDVDGWNGKASLQSTNTTVSIDVHRQSKAPSQYPTGEQTEGSLQGLLTTAEYNDDVVNGNCIVHSGTVYEMTVNGVPTDANPYVYVVDLDVRSDLSPP